MQGRRCEAWRGGIVALAAVAAAGCGLDLSPPESTPAPPELGTHFDAADAGTVAGQVAWEGTPPEVPPFLSPARPKAEPPRGPYQEWPNPHAPRIDPRTGGVQDVIVFLRDVSPGRSRPWDHPPARVEQEKYRLRVRQGGAVSRFGFVRRGSAAEMTSLDDNFYLLNARGAEFFSLAFPSSGMPVARDLRHKGVVELSGGAGQFWMRAYLFVVDHPYYARTDGEGRFRLAGVPEGEYELVCLAPNWHVAGRQRDDGTTLTTRVAFRPPLEVVRGVTVQSGRTSECEFHLSGELFLLPAPQ